MTEAPNDQEQWRPVPGYEGLYEVSDLGRVRGLDRLVRRGNKTMHIRGRMLVPDFRKNTGYYAHKLCKDGTKTLFYVHRMVLMAFRGMPEPGQEACHGNDIRTDNRLANLRWDTHHANIHDAIDRGRAHLIGYYNGDKTECDRGHPFDEENTLIRPTGRTCKACRRLKERERYHKAKAARGLPSRNIGRYKGELQLKDTEVA